MLEALWKRVTDDWADDASHGAFLQHCQTTAQLPEAAARYRGMTGDREKGESARKRLQGVAALAMASLQVGRRAEGEPPRAHWGLWLVVTFFVAATAGLIWLIGQ